MHQALDGGKMLTRVLNPRLLAAAALFAAFILQVSLVSAATQPSLLGRITDSTTGAPISDASVLVSFIGGDPDHPIVIGPVYHASTNPGGHFIVFDLPAGSYVVSVSRRGYVSFGDGAHGEVPPTGAGVSVASVYRGPVNLDVSLTRCEPCVGG